MNPISPPVPVTRTTKYGKTVSVHYDEHVMRLVRVARTLADDGDFDGTTLREVRRRRMGAA